MRTAIYIDGFNFYYGAVKNTPYKWLDFKHLFIRLLSAESDIIAIKYFTAIVTGKIDPDQPVRQKTFIRALKTYIPEIEVIYGTFTTHTITQPLACENSNYTKPFFVPVLKTEEKGSDVNLAVHLLNDAWSNRFDCAVVVSNDSDLSEALRIVKDDLKKVVGVVNPRGTRPSQELMRNATFFKVIRKGLLADSQLPDPIPGTTIHKPKRW
jgi:uncharacterized LabA/DUF88 family protein